jgi:hypothetical protein
MFPVTLWQEQVTFRWERHRKVAGFSGEWDLNYSNFDYGISNNNTDMNNQQYLINTYEQCFQLHYDKNKSHFDEMMMLSALY